MRTVSILAALVAAGVPRSALAHMTLASPVPFGNPTTSPLNSDGSNYPCQIVGDAATFYATTASSANNTLAIGTPQTLSFAGSAVHGGGSCQLALTSDPQPSASTAWQVILSIEGGCPTVDGSGPSTYDYTIPDSIAPGSYVFAWTWISKLSGAPEYYMNCAPVTITGSASAKRDAAPQAVADAVDAAALVASALAARDGSGNATTPSNTTSSSALPNLFVANLASINSCKTTTSTDPLYPDPGPNVLKPSKMTTNFQAVSGIDCFPLGATDSTGNSGNSTNNSGSGNATDPATTAAAPAAAASTTASVVVPVGTTNTTAPVAIPTTPAAAPTTSVAVPAGSDNTTTPVVPSTTIVAASSATAPAPAASTTAASSGSSGGMSGPCTNEGTFNCVGGTEYQQCASGTWSVLQAMPAGTKCKEGESTTLWARDVDGAYNGTTPEDGSNTANSTTDVVPTNSGGSGLSGVCTSEGLFNCVSGTLYQQCAGGLWSTLQAMPAGTACQEGESTTLWARNDKRDNSTLIDGGGNSTTDGSGGNTTSSTPAPAAPATGLSGPCTSEGLFNCIGGTQYQQCAVGSWSALQAMPAGTACQEGESATLWARSDKRSDNSTLIDGGGNSTTDGSGGNTTSTTPPPAPVSDGGLSGPCTTDGLFNCVGGNQYQQCAVGSWSVLQAMPAGTQCQPGESATLWAAKRRDVSPISVPAVSVPTASVAPVVPAATSVAAVVPAAASAAPVAASVAYAAPAVASAAPATGLSGACTSEGVFNCVAGTQYQQCAGGVWSVLQAMPAGTACQVGESTTLWARGAGTSLSDRPRFRGRRRRQQRRDV